MADEPTRAVGRDRVSSGPKDRPEGLLVAGIDVQTLPAWSADALLIELSRMDSPTANLAAAKLAKARDQGLYLGAEALVQAGPQIIFDLGMGKKTAGLVGLALERLGVVKSAGDWTGPREYTVSMRLTELEAEVILQCLQQAGAKLAVERKAAAQSASAKIAKAWERRKARRKVGLIEGEGQRPARRRKSDRSEGQLPGDGSPGEGKGF